MPQVDERYAGLSTTTRAWLATLDEDEIVRIKNLTRFYSRLQDRPWVLAWLEGAREDEIELLDDGIRLIRASNTVGKFLWWVIGLGLAIALVFTQFGEWLVRVFKLGGR